MSCGRHRRRPKLSSTLNSRFHESFLINKQSTSKNSYSSHSKKSDHSENSPKQILPNDHLDLNRCRILDENGDDVTPRRITDYVRINIPKRHEDEKSVIETMNKRTMDTQERSVSEKSIIGNTNLTTSKSHKFQTDTLFSTREKVTLDIGTKIIMESEYLFSKTHNDRTPRTDSSNQIVPATFLPGLDLQSTESLMDFIELNETGTMFILNLNSSVVTHNDHDEYNTIKEKNEIYLELCKTKRNNDLYVDRGMQTFNNLPKHEHIITDSLWTRSQQSWANAWDMYDSTMEAERYEGKIYRQYLMYNKNDVNDNKLKLEENPKFNRQRTMLSIESSSQNSSTLFSQESLVNMIPSKAHCFELDSNHKNQLPEIDVDAFIMERILNLNVYHKKQAVYQGLDAMFDVNRLSVITNDDNTYFHSRKNSSFMKTMTVTLKRLWNYASFLTHGRNVSCLCWNERNHNLLAVGYGKFQYNDEKEGLVCCWNVKNLEFPERYYQTDGGVTSLSFSHKRPNLLTVGLFNGNICIFDLNQNNTSAIVDTYEYIHKHTSPVWQIAWSEQDHSTEIDTIEVLISISSDSRITQWILRKDFEATDLMRLKPHVSSELSENNNGIHTNTSFVGGLCFDIHPNDKTIYLCGTDNGLIHRCSTLYNEKYLESYIGHTGPIYKVHWSPFVENIFLSASADWTIRLWMIEHYQACMIFSSSNSKMFFDVIWSPKSLDPIYIANCPEQLTLTSIAYATDSDCILVGTSDGAVWVYHLKYLSPSTNVNDLLTIVEQNIRSQVNTSKEIINESMTAPRVSVQSVSKGT
ncbi:hypothetical protein I4U23_009983 [Adineta vaga]|nr:hypothetical protein I4U23_009983 [Adineta vaga]